MALWTRGRALALPLAQALFVLPAAVAQQAGAVARLVRGLTSPAIPAFVAPVCRRDLDALRTLLS